MAISVTPGQVISWEDLNALLAQHGSPTGAKSIQELPNKPLTTEEKISIETVQGDINAPRPVTIRYWAEDGSHFDAVLDRGGSQTGDPVAGSGQGSTFRVVEYAPSEKYKAAQKKEEATLKEGETRGPQTGKRREVWRNGAWALEDNPLYDAKTDETDLIGKPTGNTRQRAEGGTTVKETEYILPDGKKEWRTQTATEAATATDQVGKPTGNTRERNEAGQAIKETEYILPDGKKEWRTQTGVVERAGRKEEPYTHPKTGKQYTKVTETDPSTNQIRVYYVDPATKQEVTLDESTNIKGVPGYTPDLTRPGAGLIDRAKQLDELVSAGTITWEQRNRVLDQDQKLTASIANEFNVGVSILREDYQNQTSQRNVDVNNAQSRAALANSHMQNAVGLVSKFLPYLGATPGDAGKLFTGMMAAQLATATAYGGMKDYPREQMSPGLKSWAERATAGAAGTGTAPTPPNAIGAGAVPGSITTPSAEARPPMEAPLPAPIFPPPPPVPGSERLVAPEALVGPRANPQIAALFGQNLPEPRQPEEDSWRQQAMNRRDTLLGQQFAGSALPELPEPTGMDLNASMGPMLSPVLDTRIPGLTPDIDFAAKQELESEWFS